MIMDAVSQEQLNNSNVTVTGKGSVATLKNTLAEQLASLRVEGYTVQDGEPTLESPVDIKCLGESGTIEVKTCGKNLYKLRNHSSSNVGITFTADVDKGTLTLSGTSTAEWTLSLGTVKLKAGNSYNIFKCGNLPFAIRGVNGKSTVIDVKDKYKVDIVTDCEMEIFKWFAKNSTYNGVITPMVTSADVTDDTFEPYKEPTQASISVESPLYEGDYIEMFADGTGQLVRNMDSVVLDGSDDENFSLQNINSYGIANFKYNIPSTTKYFGVLNCLSNYFATQTSLIGETSSEGVMVYDGDNIDLYLRISQDRFSTVEELKTWLQSNNVHVVYEKAEPTSTPLTAEQVTAFKQLYTFDEVTHVTADGTAKLVVTGYQNNADARAVLTESNKTNALFKIIHVEPYRITNIAGLTSTTENIPMEVPDGYTPVALKSWSGEGRFVKLDQVIINSKDLYIKYSNMSENEVALTVFEFYVLCIKSEFKG